MLVDWRAAATAAVLGTGVLFTCVETSAQSMPKDVAARTEIYAIPSLTISDQQFLTGDANGKEVTVAGEFRIAQGSGKLSVVVLMHGSSGVGAGMIRGCATSMRWGFRPSSSTASAAAG